ncbi:hypothetical protein [Methylocella silvestris]|uniref:Uncharacterized protein n=1 Tax=Methylocella silvestris TaxID=199596 RepID=A0A2J7TKX0_METSI|nr:hypothetical protein [Methylocella silvestris]PNG27377.1 hypothetical protein CR492_04530 [Methylocella silvestris]
MSDLNQPKSLGFGLALALGLVLPLASPFAAVAGGPFAGLSGYWTGGGTISLDNGSSERIRCKAVYAVNDTGNALNQSLRCASDSYRLEISGNISVSGGQVTGTWGEATRHANGNISGRASNSEIQARVDGAGFSAGLEVRFHGNKQSVSIRPTSGTAITNVAITLGKG